MCTPTDNGFEEKNYRLFIRPDLRVRIGRRRNNYLFIATYFRPIIRALNSTLNKGAADSEFAIEHLYMRINILNAPAEHRWRKSDLLSIPIMLQPCSIGVQTTYWAIQALR